MFRNACIIPVANFDFISGVSSFLILREESQTRSEDEGSLSLPMFLSVFCVFLFVCFFVLVFLNLASVSA